MQRQRQVEKMFDEHDDNLWPENSGLVAMG